MVEIKEPNADWGQVQINLKVNLFFNNSFKFIYVAIHMTGHVIHEYPVIKVYVKMKARMHVVMVSNSVMLLYGHMICHVTYPMGILLS